MATYDWALAGNGGSIVYNTSPIGRDNSYWWSNLNDNNDSTYAILAGTSGADTFITFRIKINFVSRVHIDQFRFVVQGTKTGFVDYPFLTMGYNAEDKTYWDNRTLLQGTTTISSKTTFTFSDGYSDVDNVCSRCTIRFQSLSSSSNIYFFSMEAFGENTDSGLRVYKDGATVKIAAETLGSHALRARKGSTTYGIPLVPTGDDNESGIRVRLGGTTYGVRKYIE